MDETFDAYFQAQVQLYKLTPYYESLIHLIDAVSEDLSITLRSDAEYFLYMNIANMVLLPIYPDFPFSDDRFREDLSFREDLRSDIRTILEEAARVAEGRERHSDISGTTIIKAVGNTIEALNLSGSQLWGPSQEAAGYR